MVETTHGKVSDAYIALIKIGNRALPSDVAYKLYLLKKSLTNSVEFQREQEKKLTVKYNGRPQRDGKISFDEQENGIAFAKEISEMKKSEITVDTDKFEMYLNEIDGISVNEIEALNEFVNFKERRDAQ